MCKKDFNPDYSVLMLFTQTHTSVEIFETTHESKCVYIIKIQHKDHNLVSYHIALSDMLGKRVTPIEAEEMAQSFILSKDEKFMFTSRTSSVRT